MEKLIKNKLLRWVIFMEFIAIGSFLTAKLLRNHLGWANVVLIVLAVYIVVVVTKVKRKYPKAPGWWRFYKGGIFFYRIFCYFCIMRVYLRSYFCSRYANDRKW